MINDDLVEAFDLEPKALKMKTSRSQREHDVINEQRHMIRCCRREASKDVVRVCDFLVGHTENVITPLESRLVALTEPGVSNSSSVMNRWKRRIVAR